MSPLETDEYIKSVTYFIIKLFGIPLLKHIKYVDFSYLNTNRKYYSIFVSPQVTFTELQNISRWFREKSSWFD